MAFTMELDPTSNKTLHMKLLRNVQNANEIQQKLIKGELKCCLIKPSLICDPLQVVIAANKAVSSESLTTKSVFTEILFNLSISKNITQSLKKFGIDGKDEDLLLVIIDENGENSSIGDVLSIVKGEEADVALLKEIMNVNEIRKAYKISDVEYKKGSLVDSVISRIATKDFISH